MRVSAAVRKKGSVFKYKYNIAFVMFVLENESIFYIH